MKTKELLLNKEVLSKITNPDGKVMEVLAAIDRDLALREQQRKNRREDNAGDDYFYSGGR
jgi:hypothetical protein